MFLLNIVVDADRVIILLEGVGSCDLMAVGFITTCAISSYHHKSCDWIPLKGEVISIQHYVISFVSDFIWLSNLSILSLP